MTPNPYNQLAPVSLFEIQSATSAGTNAGRWVYVVKPAATFAAVNDATGAMTIDHGEVDSYTFQAVNVYEIGNTTTVHLGITIADLPGTFALQPIPTGRIVPGIMIDPENPKVVVFWPNQFDGACS